MSNETKEKLINGAVNGVRLGTPGILALILWELLQQSAKLDTIIQLLAGAHR